MSTDSTELTFVRCPSCRSLVPAVSKRCRMCGAALDQASGAATETPESTGGRVRQRTMSSQSNPELAAATDQIREEQTDSATSALDDATEEMPFDDPLSAYIEEVEVTPESLNNGDGEQALEAEPEDHVLEQPDDSFDMGAQEDDSEETAPVSADAEQSDEQVEDFSDDEPEVAVKPAVRVEHGGRNNRSSGLSFSAYAKPKEQVEEDTDEFFAETEEPDDNEVAAEKSAGKREPEQDVFEAKPARHEDDSGFEEEDSEDDEEEVEETVPKSAKKKSSKKSTKSAPVVEGRLFGWLVSYSTKDGESIELREGRFFVTSNSLKDSDLILDDESVSTPHAMVTVGVNTGLVVQDLMSERGVFVRRKGSGAYEREPESVFVSNGDWLRFGDVEFLVSLVPYVGEQ